MFRFFERKCLVMIEVFSSIRSSTVDDGNWIELPLYLLLALISVRKFIM